MRRARIGLWLKPQRALRARGLDSQDGQLSCAHACRVVEAKQACRSRRPDEAFGDRARLALPRLVRLAMYLHGDWAHHHAVHIYVDTLPADIERFKRGRATAMAWVLDGRRPSTFLGRRWLQHLVTTWSSCALRTPSWTPCSRSSAPPWGPPGASHRGEQHDVGIGRRALGSSPARAHLGAIVDAKGGPLERARPSSSREESFLGGQQQADGQWQQEAFFTDDSRCALCMSKRGAAWRQRWLSGGSSSLCAPYPRRRSGSVGSLQQMSVSLCVKCRLWFLLHVKLHVRNVQGERMGRSCRWGGMLLPHDGCPCGDIRLLQQLLIRCQEKAFDPSATWQVVRAALHCACEGRLVHDRLARGERVRSIEHEAWQPHSEVHSEPPRSAACGRRGEIPVSGARLAWRVCRARTLEHWCQQGTRFRVGSDGSPKLTLLACLGRRLHSGWDSVRSDDTCAPARRQDAL